MKVKTTILAPLFLWIGFFPVYADESMAESIIVQQQVKVSELVEPYLIKRNLHFQVLM